MPDEGATLTDAAGRQHRRAGPEARIVSLVPSLTELVIDLGLKDRLVARTRFCIHPAEIVKHIPAVGGTKKASLPKLRALAPTHAILNIDENTVAMDRDIRAFVPHVIVTHPLGPEDVPGLYRLIGGIFGKDDDAAAMTARFAAALANLRDFARGLPRRRVCYFCWKDPWMTASRDTYIARTLALLNMATVRHDPGVRYPQVTIDDALRAETDLFLFATEPYAFTADDARAFGREYGLPQHRCAVIDGAYASWYGSRAIPAMTYLEHFARSLEAG